ncbi:hypothetical protein J4Q44_G00161420, partial [Coregonus suidteri]
RSKVRGGADREATQSPYKRLTPRGCCLSNLVVPARTTHVEFQVSGSLWNCRSAANKAEFTSAYATLQSLDFLALTETWITTENTPTALSSSDQMFSHTPRASGQWGGGTGILISAKWTFSLSPLTHLSISSFEFHAVTVTSPFKLNNLIIYRPPGSLGEFINELDALISSFPEDGSPLTVLDLSAAFDTVNHQILLSTLSELGISGAAHSWIASYLTGRSYKVAWRESVSTPHALTTGVPQGLVLGPLLFSLYTKSLPPLRRRHHFVYIWPFIGHCVNKPPNELQFHTTLLQ